MLKIPGAECFWYLYMEGENEEEAETEKKRTKGEKSGAVETGDTRSRLLRHNAAKRLEHLTVCLGLGLGLHMCPTSTDLELFFSIDRYLTPDPIFSASNLHRLQCRKSTQ